MLRQRTFHETVSASYLRQRPLRKAVGSNCNTNEMRDIHREDKSVQNYGEAQQCLNLRFFQRKRIVHR